ncbi:hypothetical protein [Mycolicibacterium sp.]|uniref:hypothetical protein n=1 Tax=Mycolicibacterium sp. TaxID=2320850 RepID=UPI001A230ABD|nr:hypothetical protein [Mycolicibacterium sp.]MBJ7337243.1 hypothetical protein [Mycolicibacterium sp.]
MSMNTFNHHHDDDFAHAPPQSAREQLALWTTIRPGLGMDRVPHMRTRPLGPVSDFVCESMADRFEAVDAHKLKPSAFFDEVEDLMRAVSTDTIEALVATPGSTSARVAGLDLMFVERSLCVAHGGPSQDYRARRSQSTFFRTSRRLARSQRRPLYLGWVDIANWYPVYDPRALVPAGAARDQEILLYRIQHGIERTFQRIVVEWPVGYMSPKIAEQMITDLDAAVAAMLHLRLVREHGEFDRLNRFLTPNGEAVGHATGSFSAWTMLADYVLTGHLPRRMLLEENRSAYDPDAVPFIDAAAAGEIVALPGLRGVDADGADIEKLVQTCIRQFGRFLEVHRGAIRSQASAALAEQAPSNAEVTNLESINEIIASTKGFVWTSDDHPINDDDDEDDPTVGKSDGSVA